jgi:hypothetical protein
MEPKKTGFSTGFGIALVLSALVGFISFVKPYSLPHTVWVVNEKRSLRSVLGYTRPDKNQFHTSQTMERCDDLCWESTWISLGSAGDDLLKDTSRSGSSSSAKEKTAKRPRSKLSQEESPNTGKQQWPHEHAGQESKQPTPSLEVDKDYAHATDEMLQHQTGAMAGLNFSLIPFTGWGNLAYALFIGMMDDKNSSLYPILMQDPHPSALSASAPHSSRLPSILANQRVEKTSLLSRSRADIPVLHAVDHATFDATLVSSPLACT